MSNANSFINSYVQNISQLVTLLSTLRLQNDELVQDPTLVARYFSQSGQLGPAPRTDIVAADVTNAEAALVQLLFTFDSGAPTQKSYLYKLLP